MLKEFTYKGETITMSFLSSAPGRYLLRGLGVVALSDSSRLWDIVDDEDADASVREELYSIAYTLLLNQLSACSDL